MCKISCAALEIVAKPYIIFSNLVSKLSNGVYPDERWRRLCELFVCFSLRKDMGITVSEIWRYENQRCGNADLLRYVNGNKNSILDDI